MAKILISTAVGTFLNFTEALNRRSYRCRWSLALWETSAWSLKWSSFEQRPSFTIFPFWNNNIGPMSSEHMCSETGIVRNQRSKRIIVAGLLLLGRKLRFVVCTLSGSIILPLSHCDLRTTKFNYNKFHYVGGHNINPVLEYSCITTGTVPGTYVRKRLSWNKHKKCKSTYYKFYL